MERSTNAVNIESEIDILNFNISKLHAYKIMLKEYPDVLNVEQVSMILGVCAKTTYKLLREQKIEYIKVGRALRIAKINLLSYLKIGII